MELKAIWWPHPTGSPCQCALMIASSSGPLLCTLIAYIWPVCVFVWGENNCVLGKKSKKTTKNIPKNVPNNLFLIREGKKRYIIQILPPSSLPFPFPSLKNVFFGKFSSLHQNHHQNQFMVKFEANNGEVWN